jgi:hypothetical protein
MGDSYIEGRCREGEFGGRGNIELVRNTIKSAKN